MKTGTLKFLGKDWQLIMENGKTMKVPSHYVISKELDGASVQYDNAGGSINTIRHAGEELAKKQASRDIPPIGNNPRPGRGRGRGGADWGSGVVTYATAPYNFIPLPKTVVPAPESEADFSCYREGLLSGYIDLNIEAKTDLFIRGEMERFFSIAGRPSIPGSSMRGLVRSMVELVSFSKMSFTERDRRYFYRNISDVYYADQFISRRNGEPVKLKSKAAFLVKDGRKYRLHPVDKVYRVDMNKLQDAGFKRGVNNRNRCHSQVDVWYDPVKVVEVIKNSKGFQLEYNSLTELHLQDNGTLRRGVLLRTGEFGGMKHYQWVFPEFMAAREPIDVTDIMDLYETDENRDRSASLIELSRLGNPVPCFYLSGAGGKPEFIGHTGIFRIPYRKTIGDCIPAQETVGPDIAESIFGRIDRDGRSQRSGKVFFEDCGCTYTDPERRFSALKILSSPQPTSYQLYLEQTKGMAINWDGERAKIRGQKMYWHRVGMGWENVDPKVVGKSRELLVEEALVRQNKTQFTVAEAVLKGSVFKGRLRFENLHPVELGALLAALRLPHDCAHKIGMGKPYGMGSIRIEPKVFLIDRAKRYAKMFTRPVDGVNQLAEQAAIAETDGYLDAFVRHIGVHTGMQLDSGTGWHDLLKLDERLKELYAMLRLHPSPDTEGWLSKTDYMDLTMFRDRRILKKPSEHL